MGIKPALDVATGDLKTLHKLLAQFLPNVAVWAFGSRVKWTSRPDSDLDLVVFTSAAQNRQVHEFKDALDESSLPFRVDVLVWEQISDAFRENIRRQYVVLVDEKSVGRVRAATRRLEKANGGLPCGESTLRVMSDEWKTYTVEELISTGVLAPPLDGNHGEIHPKSSDFVPTGIPFIMASDMKNGRLDTSTCAFITAKQAASLRKGFAKAGDVLLSHKATIGRTAIVGAINWDYLVLTPQVTYYRVLDSKKLNNRYLKYYFDSEPFQQTLAAWSGAGSTRAYLGITAQRKLPIVFPPIKIQIAIAEVIGALDDRIALLRETNATLEGIAQALFKSWFVDFDPVHAKQQGIAPAGMDETTAALFSDGFEASELGLVPKGWRVERIDSFIELAYGKALKANERIAGNVPVYGSGGITGYHNKSIVDAPAIIVGRKGTVGSVYWEDEPFFPIDTVFFVRSTTHLSYCFYLLKTLGLADMNTDAAVPGLNRNNVYRLKVLKAPMAVLSAFADIANTLRNAIFKNKQQAQTLATLRDTLLPRLISGQLRLSAAVLDEVKV